MTSRPDSRGTATALAAALALVAASTGVLAAVASGVVGSVASGVVGSVASGVVGSVASGVPAVVPSGVLNVLVGVPVDVLNVLVGVPVDVLDALVAHVGGLSRVAENAGVPSWLTVATGGVLVGASFLFNSLLTDHEGIRAVNGFRARLPGAAFILRVGRWLLAAAGVGTLVLVLAASVLGPTDPTSNFAILVVWAGWWGGYSMTTYLVGNTWPAINPWRTLAELLPVAPTRDLPAEWGAWPSTLGLLALVYVEVVTPLATDTTALGALVLAYTVLTLAGATRYGVDEWFDRVDPVARVFRLYGRVAPFQRTANGIEFRLPGAALTDTEPTRTPGATAFVIALLWGTTFDGLVATPVWNGVARSTIEALGLADGAQAVAVLVLYLVAFVVGFGLFLGIYRLAAARARETADSFLTPKTIERWFVPSLLPIAAGYHLAHFLGYFISLSPALLAVLGHPFGGVGAVEVAVLPAWFGTVQLAVVVLGHLLAVWMAHALAMDLFPGVLAPIRSQYPFVVVMMVYTMTSALVVGQPFTNPAYL